MSDKATLEEIRHSLAHLLATAVLEYDPEAKLGVGPAIDDGFYYDIQFSDTFSGDALPELEARMRELAKQDLPFTGKEVSPDEARVQLANQPYKLELIDELEAAGETITIYKTGDVFTDLCRGGHVESTSEIPADAFTLTHTAGAYWKGDEKNQMLTRIYGLAFNTKEELEEYQRKLEEAKQRDHKKLGRELDLYYIDEHVGKGLPMWTPKGTAIKLELEAFTRELERKYGYQHVSTPYLGSEKLYQKSGHLDHYQDSMYAPIEMDDEAFYLRPMACPHHIQLLMREPLSYRDLPIRYAELADYNRYEKSGELMGMIRVRKFQLTDGHIFVSPEGLQEEFKRVCKMIQEGMEGLGLTDIVSYRFSKRDPEDSEKYFADDELWEKAERTMKQALDEVGIPYTEEEGEAAFYGPKLDVQAHNVNGKEDTLFTAQIDFLLPDKFDITYTDKDGSEERPVMIHRSTIGALERTFAFLLEYYAGAFPVWLSPTQVTVLPIGESQSDYAQEVADTLRKQGIRAEIDSSDDTLGKRVRNAKSSKVPYFLVLGDQEMSDKTVTVETRDDGKLGAMSIEDFVAKITEEVRERK